jgi:hypothetical protein
MEGKRKADGMPGFGSTIGVEAREAKNLTS